VEYGLDNREIMGLICGRGKIILSLLQSTQTTYGAHLWAVKRPSHEVDNSSLCSAEVKAVRRSISTPLYAFKAAFTKEHGISWYLYF
jgi:hypothetical protein